jgi:hypothetical protein
MVLQVSVQECVGICMVRWWVSRYGTEICINGPDLDAFIEPFDQWNLFPLLPVPTQFAVPQ